MNLYEVWEEGEWIGSLVTTDNEKVKEWYVDKGSKEDRWVEYIDDYYLNEAIEKFSKTALIDYINGDSKLLEREEALDCWNDIIEVNIIDGFDSKMHTPYVLKHDSISDKEGIITFYVDKNLRKDDALLVASLELIKRGVHRPESLGEYVRYHMAHDNRGRLYRYSKIDGSEKYREDLVRKFNNNYDEIYKYEDSVIFEKIKNMLSPISSKNIIGFLKGENTTLNIYSYAEFLKEYEIIERGEWSLEEVEVY